MSLDEKTISLVVVDAVSPDPDMENPDIILPNIQAFVDEGIPRLAQAGIDTKIYEFFTDSPSVKADDSIYKAGRVDMQNPDYSIVPVTPHVVLVGGTLGNKHHTAFSSLVRQFNDKGIEFRIDIPFDCTYSFTQEYDSGDSWNDAVVGRSYMPIVSRYACTMQGQSRGEMKPWEGHQQMVEGFLEDYASTVVRHLSVEDDTDIMGAYARELVNLGASAVNPLKQFLAGEGKLVPGVGTFQPTSANYDVARRVLETITRE